MIIAITEDKSVYADGQYMGRLVSLEWRRLEANAVYSDEINDNLRLTLDICTAVQVPSIQEKTENGTENH